MRPARKKVQHAHDDMLERPESEQHTDDVGQDDAAHRIAAGDREKRQQGDQCAADDRTHKGGPAPAAGKVFRMCLSTPGAPVGNVPSTEITRIIRLPSTTLTMTVHKQRRADLSRQKKSDGIPLPSHVAGSGILEQLVETARGYAKQAASENTLKRAVGTNGVPDRIAIDKSGANLAGLQSLNAILKFTGVGRIINIVQSKYINNIIEQDHRFIKRITRSMLGFKAFHSAAATLAGIETAHMIRKGQLAQTGITAFKQFAALAA